MHLSHKLPWDTLASHFEFRRGRAVHVGGEPTPGTADGAVTGGLFPRGDARQKQDLHHFLRCLHRTIHEFSRTAVASLEKTGAHLHEGRSRRAGSTRPLFSDELLHLEGHPFHLGPYDTNNNRCNQLTEQHQRLDYWVERAGGPDGYYTTSQGDLADSVKLLVQLDQREALLRLLREPPHLRGIMSMSWGHSFGVDHIVYETLPRYIMMNLAYAVRQQAMAAVLNAADRPTDPTTGLPRGLSPKKQFTSLYEIDRMRSLVEGAFTDYDFAAQFILHRTFWERQCGTHGTSASLTTVGACGRRDDDEEGGGSVPVLEDPTVTDPEGTRAYLADCFRCLYLVDMIVSEQADGDAEAASWAFWETEIAHALRRCAAAKIPEC